MTLLVDLKSVLIDFDYTVVNVKCVVGEVGGKRE